MSAVRCYINQASHIRLSVNDGATPGHPSFAQVCDVPDVFAVDDRLDASFLAGPSFDSLELFQDFLEAEPLIFGDDDDHASHKPLHPGRVNVEEAWDSSWQDSSWQDSPFVPLAEYAAVPNVSAPCAAAPPTTEPTASGAEAIPSAAVSDQPPSQSQATGELDSEATALLPSAPLAYPSTAPPDGTCSVAAMGAQAMMAPWGQQGAYMMPYMPPMGPPGMVFMQQLPPWVSYVPASLRPPAVEDKEVAAECAQARSIKLTRFRQKKQRLSVRKAVRYENRKRYADARPRVNGRFISKAEGAAAARAAAM